MALEKQLRLYIGSSAASGVGQSFFRWIVLRGFPEHVCDVEEAVWRTLPADVPRLFSSRNEGGPNLANEISLDHLIKEITRPFYERCASQGLAGNPRIYAFDEATLPALKYCNIARQTQLFAQEFENALITELPKAAAKRGLRADMVVQQLPTICKLSKLIIFELPKSMDDPGDFFEQALTKVGAHTTGSIAAETKDLELVMDVIGHCEALRDFFGPARDYRMWKHHVACIQHLRYLGQ
ncbi:hypothetical protein KFL_000530410 [Klebsormidium nitens]|uniref:Uncharacterized protein n=1 Tax=Klebsormidium nitens TaxID=105231 RepID=A0A1Y1HP57_KLENI|nr:hypothetical protein KFL_000530410 [Klebsormidium nitens]|eukprot:GAQ80415.1 hypothetical protein KFL_000530410 [Klebsormidium nitens]